MAKLKMVLTKCAQRQREGACCWWPRAQAVCRAAVQTGPTSHLQSECLMHRAGFSCAASPSSGLGHLQIHGRLKQETATQSGCYTTDGQGVRTSLTSLQVASICTAVQKQWETPPNQCRNENDASAWWKVQYIWLLYMCVQDCAGIVCSFILPDGGKGNNNSSISCGWVNKGSQYATYILLKAPAKAKHFPITVYKSYTACTLGQWEHTYTTCSDLNGWLFILINNDKQMWIRVCMHLCVECIISCFCSYGQLPRSAEKGAHRGDNPDLPAHCDGENNSPLINGLELEHSTGTP